MSETMYFKDGNTYWKAVWGEDPSPENPRVDRDNLGTMVFENNRQYKLGDEQVSDFSEFFKDQIDETSLPSYAAGTVIFSLPTIEEALENPALKEEFIAGNTEIGFHFDVDLFNQRMDYILEEIKQSLGDDVCADITGGIPISDNGKLGDKYFIDFTTKSKVEGDAYNDFSLVKNAIREKMNEFGIRILADYEFKNELSDLTESQLYDKWAATKAAVVPIDVYEHSEITCRVADVRKTSKSENDRDDGSVYNNGFIYVDKDNEEFQNELKGEARDKEGDVYNSWPAKSEEDAKKWAENIIKAEVEDYARYLEGDVHTVTTASFNPSTLEWERQDFECGILGDSLESNLKSHGFNIDKILGQNEVFVLENTANSEFKKAVIADYFNGVKAELSDFNNDVLFASKSVLKQWKAKATVSITEPEHDCLNRWELKRQVIEDYLKKSKCQSQESLKRFLNENIGVKEKELEPLSFMNSAYEAVYSKVKNPSRSDNGSVNNCILIDYQNKRFAYFTSAGQILDRPSDTFLKKAELLPSSSTVERKLETLVSSGFKNSPVDRKEYNDYRKDNIWIERNILEKGRER